MNDFENGKDAVKASVINEQDYSLLLKQNMELTDKELMYRERFIDFLDAINYVPKDGESFAQCLSHICNSRYYNYYWFISNYGYLWSMYFNSALLIKPTLKIGGRKKGRETYDYFPDYVRKYYPNWEKYAINEYRPQYYWFSNTVPNKEGLTNTKKLTVRMQDLVACYFADNPQLLENSNCKLHHNGWMDWNLSPYENNNIWSIQPVINNRFAGKALENPENLQHSFCHTVANKINKNSNDVYLVNDVTPMSLYVPEDASFYASVLDVSEKPSLVAVTFGEDGKVSSTRFVGHDDYTRA